jgi:hypothetical protein
MTGNSSWGGDASYRTPMPWTNGQTNSNNYMNGASSTTNTLSGNKADVDRNIQTSVFTHYKNVIALKNTFEALYGGDISLIDVIDDIGHDIFTYMVSFNGDNYIVLHNISTKSFKIELTGGTFAILGSAMIDSYSCALDGNILSMTGGGSIILSSSTRLGVKATVDLEGEATYTLIGDCNNWNDSQLSSWQLKKGTNDIYTIENVTMTNNQEFMIRKNRTWNTAYGYQHLEESSLSIVNQGLEAYGGIKAIAMKSTGVYKITLDLSQSYPLKIVKTGEVGSVLSNFILIGSFNGWKNNDKTMALWDMGNGVYMIDNVYITSGQLGRVVYENTWVTFAGYSHLDNQSKQLVDAWYEDDNIEFLTNGYYQFIVTITEGKASLVIQKK